MSLLFPSDEEYRLGDADLTEVRNHNEKVVLSLLRDALKLFPERGICNCRLCIEDIYALTLNQLSPRYIQITSEDDYLQSSDRLEYAEAKQVLDEAVRKVSARPNHA